MTRDELWASFIVLMSTYAEILRESDIEAFVAGMLPNPTGRIHDPAFAETYRRLLPKERIDDAGHAYAALAAFVDDELVGMWKVPAGARISSDLREAIADPTRAPEPVRSWIQSLTDLRG